MNQENKITLYKSLIIEAVKNETYKSGQIEKGADAAAIQAVYHGQAGDEQYHKRLLERLFYHSLAELKSQLGEYLTGDADPVADNLITHKEEDDAVIILITVSQRFNPNMADVLAMFFAAYIENTMLNMWWGPVNTNKANWYTTLVERDLQGIRRTFAKKAPSAPSFNYPTAIIVNYPIISEREDVPGFMTPDNSSIIEPEMLFSNPFVMKRGGDTEISYTLTGEDGKLPVDDIIVRCDNPCCQTIIQNGRWHAKGISKGYTVVTLFSRHNDKVFTKFAIRIV